MKPASAGSLRAQLFVSAVLVAPIVAWPWLWAKIAAPWIAAAALFAGASVVMDEASSPRMGTMLLWLLAALAACVYAARHAPEGAWFVGLWFAARATAHAIALWQDPSEAHAWLAWGRDTVSALAIFFGVLVL